jgi:ketosteroid isomerase-like protein
MTQELDTRNLMLTVAAGFKSGNLEPLFAAIDADVTWKVMAPREFFRFGGVYHGISGVREYTALLFSVYHFARLKPLTVTAKGNEVWGLFDAEALHRPSGRYVRSVVSVHWLMKDGRIVEHQGFFDTASVLMQQGDLVVEAA